MPAAETFATTDHVEKAAVGSPRESVSGAPSHPSESSPSSSPSGSMSSSTPIAADPALIGSAPAKSAIA